MKRSFQVEIAGQLLSIRSDEGPEYVQRLADYVDAQLRSLTQGRRSTPSMQRVALLVAISLADELFRERDLHRRFRARVADKLDTLRQALDAHEAHLVTAPADLPTELASTERASTERASTERASTERASTELAATEMAATEMAATEMADPDADPP